MENCTGLVVHIDDAGSLGLQTDVSENLGAGGLIATEIYDAFLMKASWAATFSQEGLLEPMNPHIAVTPHLDWTDMLNSARALGSVATDGETDSSATVPPRHTRTNNRPYLTY
jgi:hypothetical protein